MYIYFLDPYFVLIQEILRKRTALRSGLNTKHNTTGNESDGNDRRPSNVLNLPKRTEADNPSEMSSHEGRSSAGSASGMMSPKCVTSTQKKFIC